MGDLISKKAAIDAIRDADVCVQWNGIISDEDAVDITVKATKRSLIYSVKKLPSAQHEMIREIRKWINSGNRGNADYFIVEKIDEIINKYE